MKKSILTCSLLAFFSLSLFAQEDSEGDSDLSMGTDLVSSYVWRGFQQCPGPSIQPWAEGSYKNLTLGVWGSYELTGGFKEVDLYAKYAFKDFTVQFIDLFFPDAPGLDQNFYNFTNSTTGHAAEVGISYDGSEKIPFSLYGGMIVYGVSCDPKTNDANALNRSMYFEANYLGQYKDYSYQVFAGCTPTESVLYGTNGFSFVNVGLSAKKSIPVSERFALPLKVTLSTNPSSRKIFFTAVVSL